MIKAEVKGAKGKFILLGLSKENVEGLQESKPIFIDLSEFGVPRQIAIVYGETEDRILEAFKTAGVTVHTVEDRRQKG
jgi:hypothetical protein